MKRLITAVMLVLITNIAAAEISSEEDAFFAGKTTYQTDSFNSVFTMNKDDSQIKWSYEQEDH